ncbi:unnamed protein product [Symbiodinium pilosum]|uniref:Uncharacterized protein n=1 Tax=Symbiodinium pilosum TaxID=2952 RepID=A0A812VQM5_SYMPI|nr:unnamed protein product [Symbiodinium pilosum]
MFESLRSQRAGDGSVAGIRQVELTRRVPGIDYFPFEAGAGCSLPRKRPQCELGPACTQHSPAHFAAYDHPWMKPGPELVLPSGSKASGRHKSCNSSGGLYKP